MRNEHLTWEAGGGGRGGDSFGKTKSVNEARPLAVTQALQKGGGSWNKAVQVPAFPPDSDKGPSDQARIGTCTGFGRWWGYVMGASGLFTLPLTGRSR